MGLFDRFAKDIITATRPEKPTAAAQISQQFTAGIAPLQQKLASDVVTGQYALDPFRRQLSKELSGKWGQMAKEYEDAQSAIKNAKDPKVRRGLRKDLKLIRQKFNRTVPSKNELRELKRSRMGEAGIRARAAGSDKPDPRFSKLFTEVSDEADKFTSTLLNKYPNIEQKFGDLAFARNAMRNINTYFTHQGISEGNALRTLQALTRESKDINAKSFTNKVKESITNELQNISSDETMTEEDKLVRGLTILSSIENAITEEGKSRVSLDIAKDLVGSTLKYNNTGEFARNPGLVANEYLTDLHKISQVLLTGNEEKYTKELKKLFNQTRNSVYGTRGIKAFLKDVGGKIPEFGEAQEFLKQSRERQSYDTSTLGSPPTPDPIRIR